MTSRDVMAPAAPPPTRVEVLLDQYTMALSVVMLIFGLRQWAIIVGAIPGDNGPFDHMSTVWEGVTIHMAIVDLIAAVGLWLKVAGGKVLWTYAALFEIVLHTVFIGTFGPNIPIVAFHVATLIAFVALSVAVYRQPRR